MTLSQAIPGYTPTQWADAFLQAIGAPVNATNEDTLTRWANAESGGYNPSVAGGKYNPLNVVTQSNDSHTGEGGSQGDIADFGNLTDGVAAAARLFQGNGNAAGIIQGLRSSNQPATFAAIQQFYGTWGGSINFGGAPADTSTGTAGTGGASTADLTGATTDDSDCVWKLTMPGPIPNLCVTHSQGRALLGAASLVAGFGILALGVSFAAKGAVVRSVIPGIK